MAALARRSGARSGRLVPTVVVAAALVSGCGGSGSKSSAAKNGAGPCVTETTVGDQATASTLPPGAVPGLDDYDGDGRLDPTRGTQDFGAGLVLRIPCVINTPRSAARTPSMPRPV